MMTARIFKGLDDMDMQGARAEEAARLGFLEWVLSLDATTPPDQAARRALARIPQPCSASPAALAFLAYLAQAAKPLRPTGRRKGGRRRVLN